MSNHYTSFGSRHLEMKKSPHFELISSNVRKVLDGGLYAIEASAGLQGWLPFQTVSPAVSYLNAVFTASSAAGGSRTFNASENELSGGLSSDPVTMLAASFPNDINVAAAFGSLFTSGTALSPTHLHWDNNPGFGPYDQADCVLSSQMTMLSVRDICHSLLASGSYVDVDMVGDGMLLQWGGGASVSNPFLVPTVYQPNGSVSAWFWGWGNGGTVVGSPVPLGYAIVTPTIHRLFSVYSVGWSPGLTLARSSYFDGTWDMLKTVFVNPFGVGGTMHCQDDFAATPGPPGQTTPQHPIFTVTDPMEFQPTGILDIDFDPSQSAYSAVRSYVSQP